MRTVAVLVSALALAACGHHIAIVQSDPAPTDVVTSCTLACKHAADLCGPLGDGCVPACERDQVQGVAAQLDPQCVIDAATAAAMNACGVPCGDGGP